MTFRTSISALSVGIVALAMTAAAATADGPHDRPSGGWPFAGGNLRDTHDASFISKLNPSLAGRLKTKWVFTTAGDVSATPTVAGQSLFVPDWGGKLYRIDTRTGIAVWTHSIPDYTGDSKSFSRNAPAIAEDRIVLGDQDSGTVMAVSRETGLLLWKTVVDPLPAAIITSSPVIYDGRVYVGVASSEEGLATTPGYKLSFRGRVAALDLYSGKLLWQRRTVPQTFTGGAVWGSNFAVDPRRNALLVSTGNNYSIPVPVNDCIKAAGSLAQKIACLPSDDHMDSILSLDLTTGAIHWARRLEGPDTWQVNCTVNVAGGVPCPVPTGPDYDFGSAPNLFTARINGQRKDIVGAGQKSGVYWALDADTGGMIWGTQVGPGGTTGGIEWGTATDGRRIYVAVNNSLHQTFALAGSGTAWNAGSWAALDAATGKIQWQIPATGINPIDPTHGAGALGSVSSANGVMLAGSLSGDMVALDGDSGKLLWTFPSGGSVAAGASISGKSVYWGSGYTRFGIGTGNNRLFAFTLP